MMELALIFVLAAFVVEHVTQILMDLVPKAWHQVGEVPVARYVALALGLAVAFALGFDLFALMGFRPTAVWAPWLGQVLAGLIIGRGSNFVHDFLEGVRGWKENLRAQG